jgi:N6-adenosine-specific RNA methylase IME4
MRSTKIKTIDGYRIHPVANVFPMMTSDELSALAEDIKEHGLMHPIILWGDDGPVLDGRNRLTACKQAKVDPVFEIWEFDDDASAERFVVSQNLHRRHLNTGQKAMAAARLANMRQGSRTDLSPKDETSQAEAAEMMTVGKRSVERANKILSRGVPELVHVVDTGQVTVSVAAAVSDLPDDEIEAALKRGPVHLKVVARRALIHKQSDNRDRKLRSMAALPKGKYSVVLADPPWRYSFHSEYNNGVEHHYETMSLESICSMPVQNISAKNCVLFLWATAPLLPEALEVMDSWGFTYKTNMVWVKNQNGMGYWARGKHELLLVGTKGRPPTPRPADRVSSVFHSKTRRHSEKPPEARAIIEQYFPTAKKVELFAREKAAGWSVWGREA